MTCFPCEEIQGKADFTALESKPTSSFSLEICRNIYIFPQSGDRSVWSQLRCVWMVWVNLVEITSLCTAGLKLGLTSLNIEEISSFLQ